MATSPAPDAAAPPGMCPGVAIKGGGGSGGGSDGGGSGGGGGAGGGGRGSGKGGAGDSRSVPDPNKYPDCGTASHPVDVVTGRAFTHPIVDIELPGPLPFKLPEKARAEVFRYDAAGNLYEEGREGEASRREYGRGNRLLRKGSTDYVWDDDGRLREKRELDPETGAARRWIYSWNAAGLLRSVERPDGTLVEFLYDPFARRLQKRVTRPGWSRYERLLVSETRFVWDGDVLVHEIAQRAREGGDPIVEERTYCFEDDGFAPVAHREARRDDVGAERGGWFHYVNDPIGTPERLLAESGEVACELRRSAWGETDAVPGGRASTAIRFPGQYEDAETGLFYNRLRYYDPRIGVFASADPIGLSGGHHLFRYSPNPVRWIDPLGTTKADRSWTRTNTAVGRLPRISGRSPSYVRRRCRDAGFRQDTDNPNHWIHQDGSRVRIDEPHDPDRGPTRGGYRGDVEPHYHKEWQDPYGNPWYKLDDHGRVNSDKNRTHIIGRGRL